MKTVLGLKLTLNFALSYIYIYSAQYKLNCVGGLKDPVEKRADELRNAGRML